MHAGLDDVGDEAKPTLEEPFGLPRMMFGPLFLFGCRHRPRNASAADARTHPEPLRIAPRTLRGLPLESPSAQNGGA